MAANRLAILALAVLAACGGDRNASMAADSLSRDLQRLPVDSSATLSDQAGGLSATTGQGTRISRKFATTASADMSCAAWPMTSTPMMKMCAG